MPCQGINQARQIRSLGSEGSLTQRNEQTSRKPHMAEKRPHDNNPKTGKMSGRPV